jgi:hypothetical protein
MRQFQGKLRSELVQIAFSKIPDEKEVRDRVKILTDRI